MRVKAVVFDAYGTLFDVLRFDVHRFDIPGFDIPPALAALWRQKQLEYTWLRSLMESYQDFWHVTEASLRAAVKQLKIEWTDGQLDSLMQAYLRPSTFPEVRAALESLKELPLAILSNGSPKMLESAVRHNGLESCFAEIISVDRLKTYKPSPRVYALGPETLKLPAGEILFVSSNWWDAAGAKAFGYQVCWCNRSGAEPEHLGFAPDFTVSHLNRIAGIAVYND
jgi:2-haloacid dehalogenase